jgi:glycosyltransferase involved in cell wall biosynthesis
MAPPSSGSRRIALVHDFLLDVRGAERVFLAICDLYPDADIYTAVYDERGTEGRFAHRNVNTSFLQRLRPTARTFRSLLPLYPSAIESLDLSEYDLVISSSSAWAHAVLCDESTVHVSYCHNPFRYAWNDRERVLAERDPVTRLLLRAILRRWRQWDWIAAQRVDAYVANSHVTKRRISAYWGRDSHVVHPPVETSRFAPGTPGDHYVVLSELMSHKRIDVAVRAFTKLGLPLLVVGDGPDQRRLRRIAGPTISFAGRVPDDAVAGLLASSRALVVTAMEEFGIAAVEAQAAGRPVIATDGGGVRESVMDGETGCFYDGSVEGLVAAVRGFDVDAVDPRACVENAERFGPDVFRRAFPRQVDAAIAEAQGGEQRERVAHIRRTAPHPLRHGLARRGTSTS